ncbi:MAG: zinc-ribbon domain-containing protein [Clostridia bacterium]|nr:zinc-ribbon domain-containing protein [Clostridia bacterium]
MSFCTNCGESLSDNAKFCSKCGVHILGENTNKCKICGATIPSFSAKCPACDTELREIKSSEAIKKLYEKLEKATDVFQRVLIIKNFPVPNSREDIFEFMLLAYSNFDLSNYISHLNQETPSSAWLAKMEQCYFKAKISFSDSADFKKIEGLYNEIKTNCEIEKNKLQDLKQKEIIENEQKENVKKFKKSKYRIVLIIAIISSAFTSLFSFVVQEIYAGIIAIIMVGAFLSSYLVGTNVIKVRFKYLPIILTFVGFLLIIPTCAFCFSENSHIEWENVVLKDKLPAPHTSIGEIHSNSDDYLSFTLKKTTESDFVKYKNSCISFGFNIRSKSNTNSYSASNTDDCKLDIYFDKYSKEIDIILDIPKPSITLIWNNFELGHLIPSPPLPIGRITTNTNEILEIEITKYSYSDLNSYIENCKNYGFSKDFKKSTNSYEAYNETGYKLNLYYYEDDAILTIIIYDPIKDNSLNWSSINLMKNLPPPPSNIGEISINYDWTFGAYILNVTKEEYDAYVDLCIEEGYIIDMSRYENSFYAENSEGYDIKISYEGNNTMYISIDQLDLL